MENENSIKQIISNALQEVRAVMDADTIVGQPIPLQNGTTVIPISKVSMGFASGGLDLPSKKEGGRKNFGGGGGTGVSVVPVGFLTAFADGRVEFLPIRLDKPTPVEQVADLIQHTPDLVGRFKDVFTGNRAQKKQEAEEKKEAAIRKVEEDLTERMLESLDADRSDPPSVPEDAHEKAPVQKKKKGLFSAKDD